MNIPFFILYIIMSDARIHSAFKIQFSAVYIFLYLDKTAHIEY